jgi:hypothetical protein
LPVTNITKFSSKCDCPPPPKHNYGLSIEWVSTKYDLFSDKKEIIDAWIMALCAIEAIKPMQAKENCVIKDCIPTVAKQPVIPLQFPTKTANITEDIKITLAFKSNTNLIPKCECKTYRSIKADIDKITKDPRINIKRYNVTKVPSTQRAKGRNKSAMKVMKSPVHNATNLNQTIVEKYSNKEYNATDVNRNANAQCIVNTSIPSKNCFAIYKEAFLPNQVSNEIDETKIRSIQVKYSPPKKSSPKLVTIVDGFNDIFDITPTNNERIHKSKSFNQFNRNILQTTPKRISKQKVNCTALYCK